MHEIEQFKALDNMFKLVSNMFFENKKGRLCRKPFQAGILVGIKSVKSLFLELKEEGLDYFLTTRVNQDCIEIYFHACVQWGEIIPTHLQLKLSLELERPVFVRMLISLLIPLTLIKSTRL